MRRGRGRSICGKRVAALGTLIVGVIACPAGAQTTTTLCTSSAASPCTVPVENALIGTPAAPYTGLAAGDVIIVGTGQAAAFLNQEFDAAGTIRNDGTLTNPASGSSSGGSWLRIMGTAALLDNFGTLNNLSDIYVQDIRDLGTNAPSGAGSLYNRAGAVFNNGSAMKDSTGAYAYGGLSIYDTSAVTNDGTFNNYSQVYTFKNPPTGDNSYIYNNGTLNNYAPPDPNPTVGPQFDNGGTLVNTGTFHNVTGAGLANTGTITNTATGVFINEGVYESGYYDSTVSPAKFVNQGRVEIRAGATGGPVGTQSPGSYIQQGNGMLLADGHFVQSSFDIQGGTVSGAGTLDSTHSYVGQAPNILIETGAVLSPGDGAGSSANTLTIIGNMTLNGTLQVGLYGGGAGGAGQGTQYSFLHVTGDSLKNTSIGSAILAGSLQLVLGAGFAPQKNDYYNILTADGGLTLTPTTITEGGYVFQEQVVDGGDTLQLDVIGTPATVPLPASAGLLAAGLFLLMGLGLKRRPLAMARMPG